MRRAGGGASWRRRRDRLPGAAPGTSAGDAGAGGRLLALLFFLGEFALFFLGLFFPVGVDVQGRLFFSHNDCSKA